MLLSRTDVLEEVVNMKNQEDLFWFSEDFLTKNNLQVICFQDKEFIFDPENVFVWEAISKSGRYFLARALSRLPYCKKRFDRAFENFDSELFNHITVMLNISHRCNMACVYCCAGGGTYGGNEELMSIEVAKRAVDSLMRLGRFTLYFFGGEPMLNLPVLIRTAEYTAVRAREKGVKADFILSTNGSIGFRRFPDLCQFIRENNFRVNVSLDGPRETQNRNRPFKTSTEKKGWLRNRTCQLKRTCRDYRI